MMKKLLLFTAGFAALFCGACTLMAAVPLVEKTGRLLDGSVGAEKAQAVYRAREKDGAARDMDVVEVRKKDGRRELVITLQKFPAAQFRGSEPNADGVFSLGSLEYLAGNINGWNEYSLELSGTGTFIRGEGNGVFSLKSGTEKVQITRGKIRRSDTLLTGGEALTNLRNRGDRIDALTEWMAGMEGAGRGLSRDDFEAYWKPVLLPETCAAKKRPAGWRQDGDAFVSADEIRWNSGYSERLLPEQLRAVRNSGTLLRDWEEALEWIYLQYEWETIIEDLSRETVLVRVK